MRRWLVLLVVALLVIPSAVMAQEATPSATENPLKVPTVLTDGEGIHIDYVRFIWEDKRVNGTSGYHIFGEYTNISDKKITSPALEITFTDEAGSNYWSTTTSPVQASLEPNEKGAFLSTMTYFEVDQANGASSLAIHPCHTEKSTGTIGEALVITGPMPPYNPEIGGYYGIFELTNGGTEDVRQPALYAISRDNYGFVDYVSSVHFDGPLRPGALVRERDTLIVEDSDNVDFLADEFGMLNIWCD